MKQRKAWIAMSGGVDSSVAAALLQEAGCHCHGVFMITHDQAASHEQDARRVAEQLKIPLDVVDMRGHFEEIIEYFAGEYARGRTPNPCVFCNRLIKFGRLWQYARERGADCIATGHYARIEPEPAPARIYMADDPKKDQSYVLSLIPRAVLDHILLPLGGHSKDQTRHMAAELGLHIEAKPDSQEICFIPDDNHLALLERLCPELIRSGEVVDAEGNVLGRHEGIHRYTIGQRRGLGIAMGKPVYVVHLDAESNTVRLGKKDELLHKGLRADRVNWLLDPPAQGFEGLVKIRYNHAGSPGRVIPEADPTAVRVEFDEPVSAVTPGQAAVFYVGEGGRWRLAGGGWIDEATA